MKDPTPTITTSPTTIIAIGASAGGLEALQEFFSHLPMIENCSILVAQHLSPTHKSILAQLLGRETKLEVKEAVHGKTLQPNLVYITPPNKEISISKNKICLKKPASRIGPKPSVDILFSSLGQRNCNHVIGIILSGTGSDGAAGVISLKRNGAFIIVQDPETAKYNGMPLSAIQTGMVDAVLSPDRMGEEIEEYLLHPGSINVENETSAIKKIFNLLSERTGTDFSNYKSATIGRRLEKRIHALQLPSIEEYLKVIEENPEEANEMFNTILIGVTSFFRDIKAFNSLEESIHKIIKQKKKGDAIRVWVPGCSTGEEAYTIAILFSRILKDKISDYNLQIFATDIDEKAIAAARRGIFQESSLENLPKEIQDQFFLSTEEGFEISKSLRSLVLFSKHDIIRNPPFLKLDLISCRNLLIYFNTSLQQQIMPIFHYALQMEGYLFLGKSETVGEFNDLFAPVDVKNKIFQRKRGGNLHPPKFSTLKPHKSEVKVKTTSEEPVSIAEMVKETLFNTYENPYVVVNEEHNIIEISGDVRLFLSLSPGSIQVNLIKMLNKELQIEVRSVLSRAIKDRVSVKSNIKKFELFGSLHYVRITARPLIYSKLSEEFFVVIFEKMDIQEFLTKGEVSNEVTLVDNRIYELELELTATKEQLQTYIEEIETSNEELQSLNEELQSTNEELQSSNEELETSNEELQSTNEEVQITYSELKAANEELERKEILLKENIANVDALLNNELQSFLLLDVSYRIVAFNKKAVETFELLRNKKLKVGDTIINFIAPNQLEAFIYDFNIAIHGKVFSGEKQMLDNQGNMRWFNTNYTPVIVDNIQTNGISISLLEITESKKILQDLKVSELLVKSVFNATSTGICITDEAGIFKDINEEYCRIFGYTKEELIGEHFSILFSQANKEKHTGLHQEFINGASEAPIELKQIQKDGQQIIVASSSELLHRPDGRKYKVTSVRDITKQKLEENRLRLLESVIVHTTDAVLITEAEPTEMPGPRIVYVNEAFTKLTGYTADEVLGQTPRILQGPKSDYKELKKLGESLKKWEPYEITTLNYKKNGEEFWINFTVTPVANEKGWYTHWIAVERDVTKFKNAELQKKLIADITQMFNQNLDLKETLKAVLEQIVDFGKFGMAEVWLISSDKKNINLFSRYANTSKLESFFNSSKDVVSFKKGEGIPGHIWKKTRRALWFDLKNNKEFLRWEAAKEAGLETIYGFPMFYNNEIIGVMAIGTEKNELSKNSFEVSLKSFEHFIGAEIKRKQLKEELKKIFNFSPDIICVAGMDGYFKKVNPAACNILEYTEEELLTIPFFDLTHPEDKQSTQEDLKNIQLQNTTQYYENRYITKSGKIIWFAWTYSPYLEEDLVYAVGKDITHRKEAENALKNLNVVLENRAKELAMSNQELEQFAYVASHDLQEPLRTISSFLTQLEKKYTDSLDEKAHQYIHFAVDGAKRMRGIILDLLEFSRVGKIEENLEKIDLDKLLDALRQLNWKNFEDKNGSISWKQLPEIVGYKYPLTQIFQNLISNALKYSRNDVAPHIAISCVELENHWQFSVKDNGIGIEAEYFDKIFVIFQRLHNKDEYSGTGMGLSIVKKIVENLGGQIWVESSLEEGSTFSFTILKN